MGPGVPEVLRRFDLDGRVALVTGASSGLGEAVARSLASVGARVALVARRYDRLAKLAGEIGGVAVECDLLDPHQVREIAPRVAGELGGPEILVNAAGNLFSRERAEHEPQFPGRGGAGRVRAGRPRRQIAAHGRKPGPHVIDSLE